MQLVLDGFTKPVYVADAGDGRGRLFVVEKRGLIRVVRDGKRMKGPFLDIRDLVRSEGNEQGLLSVAFHPDYAANGRFFWSSARPVWSVGGRREALAGATARLSED